MHSYSNLVSSKNFFFVILNYTQVLPILEDNILEQNI